MHMQIVRPFRSLVITALAGSACQPADQPAVSHGEDFIPQGEMRATQRFALVQEANGARSDATLYACHFDGKVLNSLGEQKLSLMLQADQACDPLTIYLSINNDDLYAARQQAVQSFLVEQGLKGEQIAFKSGANPDSYSSAADNLAAESKIDGSTANASDTSGGSDTQTH
jgi:hypothetical protein